MTAWTRLSSPPASIATASPSHGSPVGRGDGEAGDRADEHHPLDAEVEHPGALGEDLADRGEQQDRAARDARREDQLEIDHVGSHGLPADAGPGTG